MPYRVLVVDDSAFMRKIISDLIEQDPAYRVEATAKNGREAVERVAAIQPDLVTMDVEMPELNGLDALKVIMKEHPLPVIMLSGINEQGMRETIMALELGAFDFIRKPSATTSSYDIEEVGRELREQMRVAMLAKERRAARAAALDAAKADLPPAARKSRASGPPPPAARAAGSQAGGATPASPAPGAPGSSSGTPAAPPPRATQPRAQTRLDGAGPASPHGGRATADRRPYEAPAESARPPEGAAPGAPGGVKPARVARPARASAPVEPPAARSGAARIAGPAPEAGPHTSFTDLVAIGTSTGGPKALKAVLEKIPGNFPAPIVIVQHMPPNFTKSLAQRLNSLSELTVVEAEQGERLHSGTAYIAPGGYHLNVVSSPGGGYRVHLTEQEPRNGHRPSVDVLYESLLPLQALKRHAVLLTGMGSDGAKVMRRLYDAGVTSTMAESEETCVVFGMPRSAIELNCVSHVLPLHDIGPKLVQVVK